MNVPISEAVDVDFRIQFVTLTVNGHQLYSFLATRGEPPCESALLWHYYALPMLTVVLLISAHFERRDEFCVRAWNKFAELCLNDIRILAT